MSLFAGIGFGRILFMKPTPRVYRTFGQRSGGVVVGAAGPRSLFIIHLLSPPVRTWSNPRYQHPRRAPTPMSPHSAVLLGEAA